jgi:hypothetical protein
MAITEYEKTQDITISFIVMFLFYIMQGVGSLGAFTVVNGLLLQ